MRFLPAILAIVLAIYAWIELAQSDPRDVRELPRGLWALLIAIPLLGPIGWLVYGRPNGQEAPASVPRQRPRPMAPDDDAEFLRNLKIDPPSDT
ncbi:MAG: hypothetical protein QOI06_641 [Nocardioidaceae bacterium]|nr:hypothetical protein [Nocardioidaceae bacterium]